MNSPGNDLEGIAGQVASGCNLILFVTGNGSITNFPFVPTLKITTTTQRHQLLKHEMDINAGRYLDGEAMPALVAEAFDLTIATASGERTQGEKAGHSQAQLWRNWRQTSADADRRDRGAAGAGRAAAARCAATRAPGAARAPARVATERVGLVLPTSMCSSQIARLAAARLNDSSVGLRHGIDRFVALAHSEGCGFGGGSTYDTLQRTFRGYATHPNVAAALLLEHGCEKVPNDAMRREFERAELPLDRFGWASVQLDGGHRSRRSGGSSSGSRRRPGAPAGRPRRPPRRAHDRRRSARRRPSRRWRRCLAGAGQRRAGRRRHGADPGGRSAGRRRRLPRRGARRNAAARHAGLRPAGRAGRPPPRPDRHRPLGGERHRPRRLRRAPRRRRGRRRPAAGPPAHARPAGGRAGGRGGLADEDVDFVAAARRPSPTGWSSWCSRRPGATSCRRRRPAGFVEFQLTRGLLGVST